MSKSLKIDFNGTNKKTQFPNSFSSLCEYVADWLKMDLSTTKIVFRNAKNPNEMIVDDASYQALKNSSDKSAKIVVEVLQKSSEFPSNSSSNPNPNSVSEKLYTNNDEKIAEFSKEYQQFKNKYIGQRPQENFDDPKTVPIRKKDISKKLQEQPPIPIANNEDPLKTTISSLVKEKLKKMEAKLIEELYQAVGEENSKVSQISKLQKSSYIHKGISCSLCGVQDIPGIRYKCCKCKDFNLCETCEEFASHEPDHILIKIRKPEFDNLKNIKPLSYDNFKTAHFKYSYGPQKFRCPEGPELRQHIKLINTGSLPWSKDFSFRCIREKSQIIGKDAVIMVKKDPSEDVNVEITFDLRNHKPGKYVSFWQMYTSQDLPFGEEAKFEMEVC